MTQTIFTRMLNGELPAYPIAETEHLIAYVEPQPYAYGHLVCLPKHPYPALFDMPAPLYEDLMRFTRRIGRAAGQAIPCVKVGISVIGIKTPHVHIHVIPLNHMDDILFKTPYPTDTTYYTTIQEKMRTALAAQTDNT